MSNPYIKLLLCWALVLFGSLSAEAQGKMTFTSAHNGGNCVGCVWIAADGLITTETPQDFQDFLKDGGREGVRVYLNSPGGNLIAGIELGKLIRERGYSTLVAKTVIDDSSDWQELHGSEKGECLSSCAYAFFGGIERTLDEPFAGAEDHTGTLGFHQFENMALKAENLSEEQRKALDDQVMSVAQVLSGIVIGYVMEMGVDPRIMAKAAEARPDGMVYPSKDILREYGVITEGGYGAWVLEPFGAGLIAKVPQTNKVALPRQATAYCRKSDEARILMITSTGSSKSAPGPVINNNNLFKVDNTGQSGATLSINGAESSIPSAQVETYDERPVKEWGNPGYFHYRAILSDDQAANMTTADNVDLTINTSRAEGYHFFISDLSQRERQIMSLVWKNCI